MSWRTVIISSRCKLDLKMNCLVIRGEETKRIFLNEIAVLLIENTAISLTGCLIAALNEKKIKVIFCDDKRNPACELVSYYGSFNSTGKLRTQIKWEQNIKNIIWTDIVTQKIKNQSKLLISLKKEEANILLEYLTQIQINDSTNREGHAAKVYFNALFGMDFSRSQECVVNAALNYGYSIVLSAINREIVAMGYLTQIGIFHDNLYNYFNFGCDLLEPLRGFIDKKVIESEWISFETNEKHEMASLLSNYVVIDNTKQTLLNAIRIYVRSVIEAINEKDVSNIKYIQYEL